MGLGASRVIYSEHELTQIFQDLDRGYVYALVRTQRGDPWEPTPLESWDEYLRLFGNTVDDFTDPLVLKTGFLNGAKFIVCRILHCEDVTDKTTCTGAKSSLTIQDRGSSTLPATATGSITGPFTITGASGGSFTGTEVGPYTFGTGTADAMVIAVGYGADQTITLSGTSRTAQQVADAINAATTGLTASVVSNKITIVADSSSDSLTLKSVANDCYSVLGFTTAVYPVSAGNNSLIIAIAGQSDQTFTLTTGVRTATQVAADLSALLGGTAMAVSGKLKLTTTATSETATLQVKSASTADVTLGFTDTIVAGLQGTPVDTLTYEAKNEGEWGDAVKVYHYTSSLDSDNRFDVRITYTLQGGMNEYFANMSLDPTDEKYAPKYISERSLLVNCITENSTNPSPLNLPALNSAGEALTGGDNGLDGLTDSDWIGDETEQTGVYCINKLDMGIDIIVPGTSSDNVINEIGLMAEQAGIFVTYFQTPEGLDPMTTKDWRMGDSPYNHAAFSSDATVLEFGRPTVFDSRANTDVEIPNLGLFSACLSKNDISYGYSSAPVGYRRGRVKLVKTLDYNIEKMHGFQDLFADYGLNYLKITKDKNYAGPVFWEQNTTLLLPFINRKLNVKRFLVYFRKLMMPVLKWFIYQKNGPELWKEIDMTLEPMLRRLQDKNDIYAYHLQTDKDAYFDSSGALVGATINSGLDITQGICNVRVFVQPVMAAEIIKFDLGVTNAGVEFAQYEVLKELPGYISSFGEEN